MRKAALRLAIEHGADRVALNVWLDQPAGTRVWDVVRGALAQTGRGFA